MKFWGEAVDFAQQIMHVTTLHQKHILVDNQVQQHGQVVIQVALATWYIDKGLKELRREF